MKIDESQWPASVPGGILNSQEIHVWRVSLDSSTHENERLQEILSPDELERAGRFHFEKDMKRFVAARANLRRILGSYLGELPHTIRFEYTEHGKPKLSDNRSIRFNLSHSETLALYAVTRDRNVGVDIEYVRDDMSLDAIASKFFSQQETASLGKISEEKRLMLFFQYWARKEAFIKAKGDGVSFPMKQCDVSLINGVDASPIFILGDKKDSSWYGQDLFPGDGYTAAIVAEGCDWEVRCFHYGM